jgi:PadR family transcriptional regulator, regulatory protein PadR
VASTLSGPSYWVLTALTAGRRHGYALLGEVQSLSDGRVTLKVATLYASLERLQAQGFVAVDGEEIVDGRARRYFRLTGEGAAALSAEAARLEADARHAAQRLRQHGWTPVPQAG